MTWLPTKRWLVHSWWLHMPQPRFSLQKGYKPAQAEHIADGSGINQKLWATTTQRISGRTRTSSRRGRGTATTGGNAAIVQWLSTEVAKEEIISAVWNPQYEWQWTYLKIVLHHFFRTCGICFDDERYTNYNSWGMIAVGKNKRGKKMDVCVVPEGREQILKEIKGGPTEGKGRRGIASAWNGRGLNGRGLGHRATASNDVEVSGACTVAAGSDSAIDRKWIYSIAFPPAGCSPTRNESRWTMARAWRWQGARQRRRAGQQDAGVDKERGGEVERGRMRKDEIGGRSASRAIVLEEGAACGEACSGTASPAEEGRSGTAAAVRTAGKRLVVVVRRGHSPIDSSGSPARAGRCGHGRMANSSRRKLMRTSRGGRDGRGKSGMPS
ncbi:hypothetical protein C8R45DRAFT_940577 [Mycena sanguinolenta]|nr:hypothetical protein C8R45DRAFT_940577 [Mycena sanguinolenta]